MTADQIDDLPREHLTHHGVPVDHELRMLAIATLVNTVGNGATMTAFALYFTHSVGIPATQVGLAMSVAALAGLLVQVPIGNLADNRGPRELLSLLMVLAGVSTLGLMLTHNICVLCLVLAVQARLRPRRQRGPQRADRPAGRGCQGGGLQGVPAGDHQRRHLGRVRSSAGWPSALTRPGPTWRSSGSTPRASSFASLAVRRLPFVEPAPPRAEGAPRLQVLHDVPYVVVSVLTGLFAIHFLVIELAVPLWLATRTDAPKSLVAVVMLLNTVSVAIFQVRLSRGASSVPASARALAFAGAWIFTGFGLIAFSGGRSAWTASALICGGALVHVVGEMVGSGGQWGLQMGLAPRERQGQYQGFAGMSFSLSAIVAPPLITVLCIDWGTPGWFVLGGIIAACGLLSLPAAAWALRTRERYGVLSYSG